MLRILRSDSERKEFATFYNYLKNGSNMFSCMVYLPLDEHNDELYKFKVNGDSLFSTNKTSVVAGYLETVDGCVSMLSLIMQQVKLLILPLDFLINVHAWNILNR